MSTFAPHDPSHSSLVLHPLYNEKVELVTELIHDWNSDSHVVANTNPRPVLVDETLRDGLQSPSVRDPSNDEKIEILHLMESLGVGVASIGLPGAGPRALASAIACAKEMASSRMRLAPTCAARMVEADIDAVAAVSQAAGTPIELYAFVACSPIRLYVEAWTIDSLRRLIDETARVAQAHSLPVCVVIEDATRSSPAVLQAVMDHAVALGVQRFCLCDTVGHATPNGVRRLVRWVTDYLQKIGSQARLDWHGHNDRGLAVANGLAAWGAGCDRIHGTGLGIGERVGNAALDQLVLNMKMLGNWEQDVSSLARYCETVARSCEVEIPFNYPLAGRDAFRTATGVHAAAIAKAVKMGDDSLADSVYSSVAARTFGRQQEIEIGQMSGASNVVFWLASRNVPYDTSLVQPLVQRAKLADRILTEAEVWAVIHDVSPVGSLARAAAERWREARDPGSIRNVAAAIELPTAASIRVEALGASEAAVAACRCEEMKQAGGMPQGDPYGSSSVSAP